MQSGDPDFEPKAADVIGLYVNPPDHAVVFAVDEKTAIQALDVSIPCCPCRPAAPSATASSTYRHGTLSLFAALNTQSGEVLGQTVPRHTSAAFVEWPEQPPREVEANAPAPRSVTLASRLERIAHHRSGHLRRDG